MISNLNDVVSMTDSTVNNTKKNDDNLDNVVPTIDSTVNDTKKNDDKLSDYKSYYDATEDDDINADPITVTKGIKGVSYDDTDEHPHRSIVEGLQTMFSTAPLEHKIMLAPDSKLNLSLL